MALSAPDFNVNSNSKFFCEETHITALEGRDFWRAFIDTDEIRELAVKSFKALGCCGVSRIDFMIDEEEDKLYFNEINPIPGSLSLSTCGSRWAFRIRNCSTA